MQYLSQFSVSLGSRFSVRPGSLSACCGVFFKVNVGYVAKNTLRMGRKKQTHNGNRHGKGKVASGTMKPKRERDGEGRGGGPS